MEKKIQIRRARKKDREEIVKIESNSGYHKTKFDMTDLINDLFEDKKNLVFVAIEDKKIVGYRSFYHEGKIAGEGYLGVSKNYQGKGIGKKLLEKSIIEAKNLGCNVMKLEVRKNNLIAINLYKKHGFEFVGFVKKQNKIKLKMEKKL